eukprot:12413.XXX_434880_435382_1 [CDS] Oithona nana genome sequencing.
MKAFFLGLAILALLFGQRMAAPMDEEDQMEMDENQANSLENDEYTRQLYEKPDHLDDANTIKKFLRNLMSSMHDPILLKAKLIVVAKSSLQEIIADNGDMTENDAKLIQIFAMNQLNLIELQERELMREQINHGTNQMRPMGFPDSADYE